MADRRAYGTDNEGRGSDSYRRGADSYGQADAYGDPYAAPSQPDPYADPCAATSQPDPYADPYAGVDRRSPYASPHTHGAPSDSHAARSSRSGRTSPYATQDARPSSPYAAGGRQQQAGRGRVYAEGGGRAYGTTRGGATGVRPVSRDEYIPGGSPLGNKGRDPGVTRRNVIIGGACALAGVAALGVGGFAWWANRAVACEVNGQAAEVRIGASAQDIINKGLAAPTSGNLVSVAAEGQQPQVLQTGGGAPYTLTVNGEAADPATYRVSPGDKIEFTNGTDVTEDVDRQETETPCGIQIPPDTDLLNVIGYVKQWGRNGVQTVEVGKISGITVDRGVTTEAQDLIIAHDGVNPADGRKLIALTFDDGPSLEYTPQYLDILARYGAKATFFNLGLNLEEGDQYTALCRRCVEEGHQMASHTYSHDDRTLSGFDEAGRAQEISRAFDLVSQACGVPTQVMRPPYGEFRGWQYLQYVANHGDIAYSAYWGVDSSDWERKGADAIVEACTKNINDSNYNGAVILMHDGGGDRSQDVEALPRIIETYQSWGYELVTMNELLASDPTFPEWVTAGYVTRPEGAIVPDISAYVH